VSLDRIHDEARDPHMKVDAEVVTDLVGARPVRVGVRIGSRRLPWTSLALDSDARRRSADQRKPS